MDTSLSHPAALCGWPGALGQKPLPRHLPFAWLRAPAQRWAGVQAGSCLFTFPAS